MKSANWISATGRRPLTAAPIEAPTIIDSVSGVSITRSSPNSAHSPSVARKTPPFLPTSSPSTMTDSSRRISSASVVADRLDERPGRPSVRRLGRVAAPSPTAGRPPRPVLGVDVVHRGRRVRVGLRLGVVGRVVDGGLDLGVEARLDLVGQDAGVAQLRRGSAAAGRGPARRPAPPRSGTWSAGRPTSAPVSRVTLASISVGPSPARARSTASRAARVAGQHVDAVDDDARDPVARRARSATSATDDLHRRRHADRVAVVLDHEDERQLVDRREVEALVDVALVATSPRP